MMSTPVAIGSSVPAWPTRRVRASRRIRATTSCDVRPPGLSTTTNPSTGILLRRSLSDAPGTPSEGPTEAAGSGRLSRLSADPTQGLTMTTPDNDPWSRPQAYPPAQGGYPSAPQSYPPAPGGYPSAP